MQSLPWAHSGPCLCIGQSDHQIILPLAGFAKVLGHRPLRWRLAVERAPTSLDVGTESALNSLQMYVSPHEDVTKVPLTSGIITWYYGTADCFPLKGRMPCWITSEAESIRCPAHVAYNADPSSSLGIRDHDRFPLQPTIVRKSIFGLHLAVRKPAWFSTSTPPRYPHTSRRPHRHCIQRGYSAPAGRPRALHWNHGKSASACLMAEPPERR